MKSINIQIPSLIENIRIVESFIDNAKDKFNIDDDLYGNIMISITESVSNAIKHGNKSNKDKNVSLTLFIDETSLKFVIKDEGDGFDYENLPDPTAPENINNPGGRGIFIMNHLSDEVNFEDEGRIVELTFRLDK